MYHVIGHRPGLEVNNEMICNIWIHLYPLSEMVECGQLPPGLVIESEGKLLETIYDQNLYPGSRIQEIQERGEIVEHV
jgi:hypothetical protein